MAQKMMMSMSTMMLRSEEKPHVVFERRRVQLLISAGPQMNIVYSNRAQKFEGKKPRFLLHAHCMQS